MTPSRDSTSGRAYIDLRTKARAEGRPVQELFQLYILETFLDRLSRSADRDNLVLKGGVLLAAFGERRPTRDVDLQANALSNDAEVVRQRMVEIAAIEIDDGVVFDTSSATAEVIRDEDAYTGMRISMAATLLPAKHRFHVDVNVGDPISPAPEEVRIPRLLGGEISVKGYPLEMVHAEKIVTAVARGTVNTRWRDFMDVVGLAAHHGIDGDGLVESIRDVALHRGVDLAPLAAVLDGYGDIGQPSGGRGDGSSRSKIECPRPSQTSSRRSSRSPTRQSAPTHSVDDGTRNLVLGADPVLVVAPCVPSTARTTSMRLSPSGSLSTGVADKSLTKRPRSARCGLAHSL